MSQSEAEREYALLHGLAPSARDVVCIDFDGTLYPFTDLFAAPAPHPGAVEGMQRLKRAGLRLVIHTSRLSPTWLQSSGESYRTHRDYIEHLLKRDGIPYDDVTSEKVPAARYVDDRAITFDDNWEAIVNAIVWTRDGIE